MITFVTAAAITLVSCPSPMMPIVAQRYHPHAIVDEKDAAISAQTQMEEFVGDRYPRDEWPKAFQIQNLDGKWVLDGNLRGTHQQIQLDEKSGRIVCGVVID